MIAVEEVVAVKQLLGAVLGEGQGFVSVVTRQGGRNRLPDYRIEYKRHTRKR